MKLVVSLVLIMGIALAGAASAATLRVPSQYSTIQAAVDAAVAGDTVLVAAGTFSNLHHVPGSDTTQCVVQMKTGVNLIGAGATQTIIDALNRGRGIYCTGVASGRIKGFGITRGFAQNFGAGIFCTQASSPTVSDCNIYGCLDGGMIVTYNCNPTLTNCLLRGNESKEGGALAVEYSCAPTVTNCTFTRNTAPVAGGVFVREACNPVFDHCVMDSNYLNTTNGAGGGVAARHTQITLRNCRVNRNSSTGTGGGIDLTNGATALIESTLVQHDSTTTDYGPGGGIYCELSDMTVRACTISGNKVLGGSSDGGGIYLFLGGPTSTLITGCTIAGNATPTLPDSLGGGLGCWLDSPDHITLEKSIVAFNSPGRGMLCQGYSSALTVSCTDTYGNQDGDARCGTDGGGNFSQDPLFCDRAHDNFGLGTGSPCLPGHHPYGAPCGQIGAWGSGTCATDVDGWPGGPEPAAAAHYAAPNPTGGGVNIHFELARPGELRVAIYDVGGRVVRTLADRVMDAGTHDLAWDARDGQGRPVPSGVYFYRLSGGGAPLTGRIVLSR